MTVFAWGKGKPPKVQFCKASVSPGLPGQEDEHTEYLSWKLPSPVVVLLPVAVPLPRSCLLPTVMTSDTETPDSVSAGCPRPYRERVYIAIKTDQG
jgi:hypothetical protein